MGESEPTAGTGTRPDGGDQTDRTDRAGDHWRGRVAVVTGAGRGIGRALAVRLAAGGMRVVVGDLDADLAQETADLVDGVACPGDAAATEGVRALLDAAEAAYGPVEAYFANAGVDVGGGLETAEDDWALAWDVNVQAHVRAARLLVPRWLASGGGRFVVTASAAGLLTMIGSAPYSVTKHGAVAFAEWLSMTYGDRGVTVQVVCPQGVRTRMLDNAGPLAALLSRDTALSPADVAEAVWEGLQDDRFLILPHPEVAGYYALRATDTERWLGGMRRLQREYDARA